jgi:phosphopantetheine adenylyltransferase
MDEYGEPPRFLLLLPPAPAPLDAASLKVAYSDTITEVLKEVATHSPDHPKAAVLEIALACPHLVGSRNTPRSALYSQTQSLLAAVYKLITVVATQEDINVEDEDGVDARVLLVAWSLQVEDEAPAVHPYGPIIGLDLLAKSARQWQFAFGVESEAGEAFVKAFIAAKGRDLEVERLQSGPVTDEGPSTTTRESSQATAPDETVYHKHYHVAVGGTWDHLHIGHKLLLTMTIFAVDERDPAEETSATIGITGDQLLVNKKHANLVESWIDRQKAVATFLNALVDFSLPSTRGQRHASIRDDPGANGKSIDIYYPSGLGVKCTEIQDPFGPTITEEEISALVLSAETRAGGKAVNDKRKEQGWRELDLYEVDVLDAEDEGSSSAVKEGFGSKISSTAIRAKLARKNKI